MGTAQTLWGAPMIALDEAFDPSWLSVGGIPEKDTAWWQIPGRIWEVIGISIAAVFHGAEGYQQSYQCRLPLPSQWTAGLIKQGNFAKVLDKRHISGL